LIDKFGVKLVLGLGFLVSAIGSLFLIFIATDYPSMLTIFISLMFVGLGIGFTMGTPLNYMMLDNTKQEESNSALATVSLIRSIGTTIAPAIMIGFIAHAGTSIQGNIMPLLPSEVAVPELPYSQEISAAIDEMKANPAMAEKLNGIEIPDLSSMQTVKFDMNASNSQMKLSDELLERLQSSDVTTITEDMKFLSSYMFEQMTPGIVTNIQNGVQSGITAMQGQTAGLEQGIAAMKEKDSIPGMDAQIAAMTAAKDQMADLTDKMTQMNAAVPGAFETAKDNYLAQIDTLKCFLQDLFVGNCKIFL